MVDYAVEGIILTITYTKEAGDDEETRETSEQLQGQS